MGNNIGNYKNCELATKYETSGGPCSVYGGFAQDDTEVTVFVYDTEDTGSDIIHNSVKVSSIECAFILFLSNPHLSLPLL